MSVCLFVRDSTHASCSCVAQKITGDIGADSILLLNEFQGFNVGIQVCQQVSLTIKISHMEFLLNILHSITHVICFLYILLQFSIYLIVNYMLYTYFISVSKRIVQFFKVMVTKCSIQITVKGLSLQWHILNVPC